MNKGFAPIVLFTYKRLDTLNRTVSALQQNFHANESELFIFSDAAKTLMDEAEVNNVRTYINTISGFKNVYIFEATKNKGLARSVIDGVSMVIKEYGRVIVVEDDILTSQNFLSYMNQALEFYLDNPKVFSISAYSIPISPLNDYVYGAYFLPRLCPWGWATWKNQWEKVDWEVNSFDQFKCDKSQIKAFKEGGSDMYKWLRYQMSGKIDSWSIRCCYHRFRINAFTLYPIISKVQNIGFDKRATHTHGFNRFNTPLDKGEKETFLFSEEVKPDYRLLSKLQSFYSLKERAIGKIKTYLSKII